MVQMRKDETNPFKKVYNYFLPNKIRCNCLMKKDETNHI